MREDGLLLAFALGTFHAVVLTLGLLLPLYLTIDLGEALAELNTAVGLAVFGALWATSVYCTRRAMLDAGLRAGDYAPAANVLRYGTGWGAWNGVLFFWCLLAGGAVALLVVALSESADQVGGVIVFGIIAFGVGTILSSVIGSVLGFLFAVLDIELLWAARALAGADSRE